MKICKEILNKNVKKKYWKCGTCGGRFALPR
jgi:ribosomal protein L37AE/L43A